MRTALILAFAATGKVSLLSEPSAPFDEQRALWAQLTTREDLPEEFIRYEFWTAERGLQKKFVPGEHNSANAAAVAEKIAARSKSKADGAQQHKPAPVKVDPKSIEELRAKRVQEKNKRREEEAANLGRVAAAPQESAELPTVGSQSPADNLVPGPSLAEYVAAGYKAETYPPKGWAPAADPDSVKQAQANAERIAWDEQREKARLAAEQEAAEKARLDAEQKAAEEHAAKDAAEKKAAKEKAAAEKKAAKDAKK